MRTLLLVSLLFAAPAFADEAPPDLGGCRDRKAGDACKTDAGTDGTCEAQKCGRIDYSRKPPGHKEVDCLICVAGKPKPHEEKKSDDSASRRWFGVGAGGLALLAGLGVAFGRRRRKDDTPSCPS